MTYHFANDRFTTPDLFGATDYPTDRAPLTEGNWKHIGSEIGGIDGVDQYYLVSRNDDDIDHDEVDAFIEAHYYDPGSERIGSWFMHHWEIIKRNDSAVIVILHHRRNV